MCTSLPVAHKEFVMAVGKRYPAKLVITKTLDPQGPASRSSLTVPESRAPSMAVSGSRPLRPQLGSDHLAGPARYRGPVPAIRQRLDQRERL
jgi:hypothetical protein